VFAGKLHAELRPGRAVAQHLPLHDAALLDEIDHLPCGIGPRTVELDRTERLLHAVTQMRRGVKGDDASAPGNEIDEAAKGSLHGIKIEIDVGVVKLNMRENQRVRKVVHELRPFIKEGRVVFIALNDESLAGLVLKAGAEVLCDAANQKRWREPGMAPRGDLVDPGQHAGRGGFAVRAGDDERFAPGEEFIMNDLRHGGERQLAVKHVLQFSVAARDGVADDGEIGRGLQVGLGKRLGNGNAKAREQVGHGRIGRLIGAGDAVALLLEESGERGHGRAADADEMNVLVGLHV